MPRVSVLIPAYNYGSYLKETLDSVFGQTYRDFEVIVVNDGSTDDTAAVLETYGSSIRVIHQQNKGIVAARNETLRHATGEFLAFLDADDIWLPRKLEWQVALMDEHPDAGLCHGHVCYIRDGIREERAVDRKSEILEGNIAIPLLLRKTNIATPTVLIRSQCIEKVGPFDPEMNGFGSEDRDLWIRIAFQYPIVFLDRIVTYYRIHPESFSTKRDCMLKGRIHTIEKVFEQHAELPERLKKQAYARVYKELGDDYFSYGRFREARKEYFSSLLHQPWSLHTFVNFLKTWNPSKQVH